MLDSFVRQSIDPAPGVRVPSPNDLLAQDEAWTEMAGFLGRIPALDQPP